jgi:hypothetical protein
MADYFTGYQSTVPQTSLADMMNLATQTQQYKQAQALNPLALQAKQLELQQAQAMNPLTLQAKQLEIAQTQALNPIARQKAAEDLRQLLATNPDIAARIASESKQAGTAADVAAAIAPSTISSAQSAADTAATQARSAQLKTSLEFAQRGTNIAMQLLDDPNKTSQKVKDAIRSHMEKLPWVKPKDIDIAVSQVPNVDGEALTPHLIDYIRSNNDGMLNALNQKYPSPSNVNVGNAIVPLAAGNQALTGQQAGRPVGTGVPTTVPPTQQYVDETGRSYVVVNNQRQYTGIGPAATASLGALGTTSGTDWNSTVADANAATNTRSIYDKIRAALPLAFTGVGSDKKQFLSKVAQAIGVSVNTLETTNTEELVKNSKLLQVVGGNTDAARSIAELANPSANMTLAGNQKIIEQLDGQEKFKEQKANFLEPVAGDPTAYQQRLRQWNAAADPLFYTQMSQEDAAQMMGTMSAARKAELMQKRDRAKALGILQ